MGTPTVFLEAITYFIPSEFPLFLIISTILGPYIKYTAYNPYIYSIISDYYAQFALYAPADHATNDPNIEGYSQLALVENTSDFLLTNYKNIFNPVSIFPPITGTHQWVATTAGDYGNTGNPELAMAATTNDIYVSSVDPITKHQSPVIAANINTSAPVKFLVSGKFLGMTTGPDAMIAIGANNDIDLLGQTGSSIASPLTAPFQTSINIVGAASGDFDPGSIGDEVLLIDNSGNLYLLYYSGHPTNPFNIVTLNISVPSVQFSKMTAGHYFDNSSFGGGAEFAIADNSGFLSVYSLTSNPWAINSPIPLYYPPAQASVNWDGLCSGDFMGTGYAQIAAHSGYDGQFLIYGIDPATHQIALMGAQAFPDGDHMPDGLFYGGGYSNLNNFQARQKWQNGLMATLKSCPGATNSAIATLRNCDGQVSIFDMEGNCQGLTINNNYFYDQVFSSGISVPPTPAPPPNYQAIFSISNSLTGDNSNYPMDYHVSRNLNASNDIIYPDANVNFIAGNAVNMTDGFSVISGSNFSATIDGGLSCSPNIILPRTMHHNTPLQSNPESPSKQKEYLSLAVQPNPNNGSFSLKTLDGKTGRLYIYNIVGKLIFSNEDYSLNIWSVDLSAFSQGIYWAKVITEDGSVRTQKIVLE